jgi:hypothetical protein
MGCFPLVGNPGLVGASCEPLDALNGMASQLDSCGRGAICWSGFCNPYCQGMVDVLICPSNFGCAGFTPFFVCIASCDPLEPNCLSGEICAPSPSFFQCVPASDNKMLFEPCAGAGECGQGLVCSSPERIQGCPPESQGCCNSLCDLDNPVCQGEGQTCEPFYAMPSPEYEKLGVCTLPL